MDRTQSVKFFNRGPSEVVRLLFFLLLSLLLMFIDGRYNYLESTRAVMAAFIQPFQRLSGLPAAVWNGASDYLVTQGNLARSNILLREQHELDAAQLLELQGLRAENEQLHKLFDVRQRSTYPMQLAEVLYTERDLFRHKVFLNKGNSLQFELGQVVMDDLGIVGQVTRVYSDTAEVTLVTDKGHEVPVQVQRNGLRAILYGAGESDALSPRYMPITADIEVGDVLLTSGLDGLYPPGIPVARVTSVERDPAYPFTKVGCVPLGGVNRHRYLMVLTGLYKLPVRPEHVQEVQEEMIKLKRPARKKSP